MQLAIFGIDNDGVNLVANLFVMALVIVWLALIVWTYFDASRRIKDPVLVACATAASLFPYIGTFVYSILRPPEFLEDARERELETRAAELRVRQLSELSCPNCRYPIEKTYLRCPKCQRRLKDPCESCGKPVDPRWALCPYCETALPGRQRQPRRTEQRAATRAAPKRTPARRPQTAPRPAQRPASPTAGKNRPGAAGKGRAGAAGKDRAGAAGEAGSAETAERPRLGRGK
jgi:Double zinc ribbon